MRVTHVLDGARHFTLGFELLHNRSWTVAGVCRARMRWIGGDFLRGKVRDAHGAVVGSLTLAWVSPYLRRATVEIDRIPESERALQRSDGLTWRDIFDPIGWDMTVAESDADLAEASGESWSNAELHAAMLERRARVDLDREWRYWLVCVRRLDAFGADRGIMFDLAGGGSNSVPREGAAVASHWMVPDEELWGTIRGARFGTTDQYFRTAVHEIGHALGLDHNDRELGIMMPTDKLAKAARPPEHFPANTNWAYATDDRQRLRHWPDPVVRPGGLVWSAGKRAPFAGTMQP